MTTDAQTALRNLIESYADNSRFIFTANRPYKIIGAIQSRCQTIEFTPPPLKERYRILAAALQADGIEADAKVILGYVERYPDLRRMLMNTQRAYLEKGHLPAVSQDGRVDGAGIFELVTTKDWAGLRGLTSSEGFDPYEGLRALFWAVPDAHPKVGLLRYIIGKGVHESAFSPDPIILFLGTCAEAMEGL